VNVYTDPIRAGRKRDSRTAKTACILTKRKDIEADPEEHPREEEGGGGKEEEEETSNEVETSTDGDIRGGEIRVTMKRENAEGAEEEEEAAEVEAEGKEEREGEEEEEEETSNEVETAAEGVTMKRENAEGAEEGEEAAEVETRKIAFGGAARHHETGVRRPGIGLLPKVQRRLPRLTCLLPYQWPRYPRLV